jgi:predicted porin
MNQALTATLLAAVSGACVAQTDPANFRLYGIVDAGVVHMTGVNNKNQLVSGIMEGSRFGIRGEEDLGGGWRTLFRMENRTELDTGGISSVPQSGSQAPDRLVDARLLIPALCPPATPSGPSGLPTCLIQGATSAVAAQLGAGLGVNLPSSAGPSRFWDRTIYVGLVTPFGAILAGRQYTPAYEILGTFDIMNTQSGLAAGQVAAIPAGIDIRLSKSLQYRIELRGLKASAMYAFGSVAGNSAADRFGGVMASYKTGPLEVGAGYNKRNNDRGLDSLKATVIGASYEIGPGKVSGMVMKYKDDNPSGVSGIATLLAPAVGAGAAALVQTAFTDGLKQDAQLVHIGYKMTTGPNTFYVAYSAANDKRPANADVASYGVAYSYALSKRTDLNLVLTHFDNKNLAQAAPGGQGYLGGVTRSAGTDSNSLAFGIRHNF